MTDSKFVSGLIFGLAIGSVLGFSIASLLFYHRMLGVNTYVDIVRDEKGRIVQIVERNELPTTGRKILNVYQEKEIRGSDSTK